MKNRCQGWRRYGGMFTFGPVRWVQCKNKGVALLTTYNSDNGEIQKPKPACVDCWIECIESEVLIIKAVQI
jgi:hypothetical protein